MSCPILIECDVNSKSLWFAMANKPDIKFKIDKEDYEKFMIQEGRWYTHVGWGGHVTIRRNSPNGTMLFHRYICGEAINSDFVVVHMNGSTDQCRENLMVVDRNLMDSIRGLANFKGGTMLPSGKYQVTYANKYIGMADTPKEAWSMRLNHCDCAIKRDIYINHGRKFGWKL